MIATATDFAAAVRAAPSSAQGARNATKRVDRGRSEMAVLIVIRVPIASREIKNRNAASIPNARTARMRKSPIRGRRISPTPDTAPHPRLQHPISVKASRDGVAGAEAVTAVNAANAMEIRRRRRTARSSTSLRPLLPMPRPQRPPHHNPHCSPYR